MSKWNPYYEPAPTTLREAPLASTYVEHAPAPDTSLDRDTDGPAYRKPYPLGFAPSPRHRWVGQTHEPVCMCTIHSSVPRLSGQVWVHVTANGMPVLWRTLSPLCRVHYQPRHRR